MKTKVFLTAVSAFLLLIAFSSTNAQTDLTKLKYFQIDVVTADDSLFLKVQKEMEIDPFKESYILVVNISLENNEFNYIVFGKDDEPTAIRMPWYVLSKEVRDGLIAWAKPNKTVIEK